MKRTKVYMIIAIILILLLSFLGEKGQVVEQLQVPIAVGTDIKKVPGATEYSIPMLIFSFEEKDKMTSEVVVGRGLNIGATRENRQLKSGKRFILGLNKVFVYSEATAADGLKIFVDAVINNPDINDRALCVVCKGKSEDILRYKAKGYPTPADFIEGMVRNLKEFNFFPMQYSVIDLIVRIDTEGRNLLLPYIEIKNEELQTTGLAIFKGDKMVAKADLGETKIINILKENNVRGILTLQNSSKEYINCYTKSNRKIKCYKKDGKYQFIIDLDLKGEITNNELNRKITSEAKELKKFEKEMANYVEKMCNDSINKIKCNYKADILDLGRVAAAKYGRGTGADWNTVICDSDIKVNVKFSVTGEGRGDY